MINQGYSYKVINRLGNLENENLFYSKKEEQQDLLQKVLTASETAADEEDMPSNVRSTAGSQIFRSQGTLSSLSGGDEGMYAEIRRGQSSKEKNRHPLFKKFHK